MRFIIDTNTIISALLLPASTARQAFDKAFDVGVVLVSDDTLAELTDVIKRPRFDRYIREEERLQFLTLFISTTTPTTVVERITDCRDRKDNKFLEVAVAGSATHIITGDGDLLVLNPFRNITIITPREFLDLALPGS